MSGSRYFRHDAFRLEVQPTYAVDVEREALGDFARGELRPAAEYAYYATWLGKVLDATTAGRTIERVRILETPPSPYQQFELALAPYNLAAGETLRTMPRSVAREAGIPDRRDWWLFDGQAVALMEFAADGTPLGGTILTDPVAVARYCSWRDLARRHGTPFTRRAAV
jgi:hypothetical protein